MLEKYQWIPHDTTGFWMTKWPQMEITACAKNWQTRWFYRINMLALARCPDEIGSEGFFHHWTIPKPIGIERSWHWALIADAETRFSIQWFWFAVNPTGQSQGMLKDDLGGDNGWWIGQEIVDATSATWCRILRRWIQVVRTLWNCIYCNWIFGCDA